VRILVLAGGDSAERDVSLESGRCVADALAERGHCVDLIDPAEVAVSDLKPHRWDVAFPVVHGTGGEDGVLQRQLQQRGIRYVGSSPAASELTFDKIRTNNLLKDNGICVPESVVVYRTQSLAEQTLAIHSLNAFGDNAAGVVTKPPRQGSSVGISIVKAASQLQAALELAFQYDDECLVERFIAGREITVPVIDGVAFPAVEIRPASDWYDYNAKYVDDRTDYIVSPPNLLPNLSEVARFACDVCGVIGIARVDFRLDAESIPWLLEINTVPGMTSHSLVPKSAAARDLTLGQLCESSIRRVQDANA